MEPSIQEQIIHLHGDLKRLVPLIDEEDFPDILREFEQSLEMLVRPLAHVVFSGLFSSGKSSVINMLIARDLLPYDELRETGVPCILARGSADRITIQRRDNRRDEIPFDKEAIRREISLSYGIETGRARTNVDAKYVTINMKESPIPKNTLWIDAPGIDDSQTKEVALDLIQTTDVLAVVIHTASKDAKELEHLVRDVWMLRSPSELVFIVNVWFNSDKGNTPQAWQELFEEAYPAKIAEIRKTFTEAGYSQADQLRFFPITAMQDVNFPELTTHRDNLLAFFQKLVTEKVLLAKARLSKIAVALHDYSQRIPDCLEQSVYKGYQEEWNAYQAKRRARMEREAETVWSIITELTEKIDQSALAVKAKINADNLPNLTDDLLTSVTYEAIDSHIQDYTIYLTKLYQALLQTTFVKSINDTPEWESTVNEILSSEYMEAHGRDIETLQKFLYEPYLSYPKPTIKKAYEEDLVHENNIDWDEAGKALLKGGAILASFLSGKPYMGAYLANAAMKTQVGDVFTKKGVYRYDPEASLLQTRANVQAAANAVTAHIRQHKEAILAKWLLDEFDKKGKEYNPDSYLSRSTYYEINQAIAQLLLEGAHEAYHLAMKIPS